MISRKTIRCFLFALPLLVPLPVLADKETNDSEILNRVSIRKIEKGKLIALDSLTVQINRRKGDDASAFVFPYSKGEKFSIEEAWIEDMQGNILRKLKKSDVVTRSYVTNAALYQDDWVKEFQLRHNVYPYKIGLIYKYVSSEFMSVADWMPCRRIDQSVVSAKLIVEIPKEYEIRYKYENITKPVIETLADKITYTWQTSYTGRTKENFAPWTALNIPDVKVLPLHFKYGVKGSWETWQTFGDWMIRLNADARKLPVSEQRQIDRLLNGITDTRQKISVLYRYLQRTTRYINVKINTGGFKTYPAEYVAANKYGDCKALSNYMISLLEYAGIPAYYTLIRAGDEIEEIDETFPGQVFNHVIVTVPLEKDTLYLECTDKNCPPGYMGTFTQGRKAFVADKKSYFVQIPRMKNENVVSTFNTKTNLWDRFSTVEIEMLQKGHWYDRYSYVSNNLTNAEKEKYVQSVFPDSYRLENFVIENTHPDSAEIKLSVTLKMQDIYKIFGKDIFVNPFARALPYFESSGERTQAVQLDYPVGYSVTNIYIFPEELAIKAVSRQKRTDSKYGTCDVAYDFSGNQLTVTKQIRIFAGKYATEEYPSFYQSFSEIKNNEQQAIHLELEDE